MKKEKTERLDKILASSGYGSRKDVKKLIKTGQVLVNGQIVKTPVLRFFLQLMR